MKSIAQIVVLITTLPTLSTAYSATSATASYLDQINAPFAKKKNNAKTETSSSASTTSTQSQSQPQPQPQHDRPNLSRECWAHRSAQIDSVDIRETPGGKGLGAFSTAPIKDRTFIGEYKGESMTINEVNARFWNAREPDGADKAWTYSRISRNQDITGGYLFDLYDGSYVCAEDADQSNWTRFMNHASEDDLEDRCNVKVFTKTDIGGEQHFYPRFFAIRDIEVGEELQFDYGPKSPFR